MNRNTRKGLGAILAGVGMTTLLGVMSGTGIVRATADEPDEGFPQEEIEDEVATTLAEVTMKERCIWYVSGVASTITLTAVGDPDAVYDGDRYPLSTTLDDYVAWTSGNVTPSVDPDAHEACTFFGDKTGISVDGLWSGNDFTAEAQTSPGVFEAEDTMDFVAADADVLTMVVAEGECRAEGESREVAPMGWSVATSIVASGSPASTPILTLLLGDATERPADEAGANDKCNADMSVTASIPAGKTPAFAGKPYKFTGPTFTTEILINTGS
jgi:hypothetical protein